MKLFELIDTLYTTHGNARCDLKITTPEIRQRYGSDYNGTRCEFSGVSGMLTDVPVYLGGYDVKKWSRGPHPVDWIREDLYTVEI